MSEKVSLSPSLTNCVRSCNSRRDVHHTHADSQCPAVPDGTGPGLKGETQGVRTARVTQERLLRSRRPPLYTSIRAEVLMRKMERVMLGSRRIENDKRTDVGEHVEGD